MGYFSHAMNVSLIFLGQPDQAKRLRRRLERAAEESEAPDPTFLGYLQLVVVWMAVYGLDDLGEAIPRCETALEHFEVARNELATAAAFQGLGDALLMAGDLGSSEATSISVIERAEHGCQVLGLRFTDDRAVGDRFTTLRRKLGDAFIAIELPSAKQSDHSVLTEQRDEESVQRVIEFFRDKLLA